MKITNVQAADLLSKHYGKAGEITLLPGEMDANYKVKTASGERYIFKISSADTDLEYLKFQTALLEKIKDAELDIQVPHLLRSKSGESLVVEKSALGEQFFLRLHSWVSGNDIAHFSPQAPPLLAAWGAALGQITRALQGYDHPQAKQFLKWDLAHIDYSQQFLDKIETKEQRELANYFFKRQNAEHQEKLKTLRTAVVHNDGNDYNVMVQLIDQAAKLTGIIDFGDAIHTQIINDLAITCAYAGMHKLDPLSAVAKVISGYHQEFPLQEAELEVLFDQIAARLLITVSSAADNRSAHPDNEYLSISEAPAWELLQQWRNIHPDLAHYTFRSVCGFTPYPKAAAFENWCEENQPSFARIINTDDKTIFPMDLSIGSPALGNYENYQEIERFEKSIANLFTDPAHEVGFGGYAENRPFYSTDAYRKLTDQGHTWRTTHLGLDLWAIYKTKIYAFMSGIVYCVFDDIGMANYGPGIIIQHKWEQGTFYTLYGHLTKSTIEQLEPGQKIEAGEHIASIGSAPENGNWPAHLHFQIIHNLFDFETDFPGVAFPETANIWLSNSPNPALLFPQYKTEATQIDTENLLNERSQNLGKNLSISYAEPLTIVRGQGQYLINPLGQKFLDTVNNVAHVGHEHPRLVQVAHQQNGLLNTNTRYLHPNIVAYAEELLKTFPAEYEVCYFVNSGSEANELAMRMCDAWSGGSDMVAVEMGYHGNTQRCISVSSYKFDGKGGQGKPENTHILPMPDGFRGIYRGHDEATGKKYAAHVADALQNISKRGGKLSGFIGESILSCGGQIVLPPGYLEEVYRQIREAGGLCIADEVQVGFGRVGEYFWGFELQNVKPDIVTLGKPIGNGHPLAAVVTTRAVADAFNNGMEFFNTFGGNPVSCAIGIEVLQIIKDEDLQKRARESGEYLKLELEKLQQDFPLIADVRGHGLFLGIELIRNIKTMIPADWEAAYIANRMRQMGVLMSTDGPDYNVLKIKPPLCIEHADLEYLLDRLKLVLQESMLNQH